MRTLGQLLGQIATDVARTGGGVEELSRLGMGTESAIQPAVYRPGSDDGWLQPTAGGAPARPSSTPPAGRTGGAGFQTLPAGPQVTTYDDGSQLIALGDGRFTAVPSTEYHREFAIAQFAARTGQSSASAAGQVAGLAERLGPGGDTILAQALATGQMTVGMLGITPAGRPREAPTLETNRGDTGRIIGRGVDVMLDNTNWLLNAFVADPNLPQLSRLSWLLEFNRDAGIKTDIAVHSNGVNALASALRLVPDARLGEVRLIDVNVSGNDQRATEDLRRIVNASTRTELVASALDFALAASLAGDPTRTLIPTAAAAGVEYIRVLRGAFHNLDDVAAALAEQGREGQFDFRRNESGQMVPVNEAAWREAGYTWSNGRLQYNLGPVNPAPAPRRGTLPRPSRPARGAGRGEA